MSRVTHGTRQAAGKGKAPEVKQSPTLAAAQRPAPALSERALRRTGKASGFTKTFAPLPSSGSQPQLASEAPVMRAGSAATMQRLREAGGELPTSREGIRQAEQNVAFNAGHVQEWSMAELRKAPQAFLKNVVQIDGALNSTIDRTACGPTALLMGMIAGNPQSIQELASKLVDRAGNFTSAGAAFANSLKKPDGTSNVEAQDELQRALRPLSKGEGFTAADVTTVANSMQGVEKLAGAAPNDLKELSIAMRRLGVKVPPMDLQLFGEPGDKLKLGHWRVVSKGTQFNPWPNDQGQSTQVSAKEGEAAGKKDGRGWVLRETLSVGAE